MNTPTELDIALAAHLCPIDDDREMADKWRAEAAQLIADHVAQAVYGLENKIEALRVGNALYLDQLVTWKQKNAVLTAKITAMEIKSLEEFLGP